MKLRPFIADPRKELAETIEVRRSLMKYRDDCPALVETMTKLVRLLIERIREEEEFYDAG